MRRSYYITVLFLLFIMAIYFFYHRSDTTLSREFSDFAIEDTSIVDRIFIADYSGGRAELRRSHKGGWIVNGKYKARQDGINQILDVVSRVRIKEPVSAGMANTVVREMAARSIKVEIYTGDEKPGKIYYIGNSTPDHQGTYMLLEYDGKKSERPFVTHIRGFAGFLTPRFFTDQNLWRDRSIFHLPADSIESVLIKYAENPQHSFQLTITGDSASVRNPATGKNIVPINREALSEYLGRFSSVYFEYIPAESPLCNIDSILATVPLHEIEVADKSGKKTLLKTFRKPVVESMMVNESTGEYYTYDLDRLYVMINGIDFVVMQWPSLDGFLAYGEDFRNIPIVDN